MADLKNRTKTKDSEKQVTSSTDHLLFSVNELSAACLFVMFFSCIHKNITGFV